MKINPINTGLFVLLIMAAALNTAAQPIDERYPIIPFPARLTPKDGSFTITPATAIVVPGNSFKNEADQLNRFFTNSFGKPLKKTAQAQPGSIVLKYDQSIRAGEGYRLVITPQQATLSAGNPAGMLMAVQTIRQLLPSSVETSGLPPVKKCSLPAVTIEDQPAYAWRGMMLDVSRHFFSVAYLKKFIDRMVLYKMNKFHLHLTDDQGWRIEIKKYPKLTEEGAWRTFNNQDSACIKRAAENPDFAIDPAHIVQKNGKTLYGGFYTQVQMKDVVAYAAARHIEVIPEIDMPGHMMAAINSYPFLTCNGENTWGTVFTKPICPGNESTYEFAQNVFTEIMDIFPSRYIHIGGDEVDRADWAKSESSQALMAREGIKNLAGLHSYFINRMEKFFNSKGRKLIGWDEVVEGGISPTANIMFWRPWAPKAAVDAARNGNQVIMTPNDGLYFDAIPDKNSIPVVYNYNIVPKGFTDAEAQKIIGGQANIWTEMIPTENRADYMYMPRMTALSEVLWTNRKDYPSYLQRLTANYSRLEMMKVHYRLPDLSGFHLLNVFTERDTLRLTKPLDHLIIRYTADGSTPVIGSAVFNGPLVIDHDQELRVAAFRPDGSRGDVYNLNYQKQALAEPENPGQLKAGLLCSRYKGRFRMVQRMAGSKPDTVATVQSFTVPKALETPSFGLQYRGYLDVPQDGVYSFYLTCDDGGVLKIADREVVNNDGNHSPAEKDGQVALKKGPQKFALDFIEAGGGYTLKLKYSINGSQPQDIPAQWLKN